MEVKSLEIEEVKIAVPRRFGDERGFFEQLYHQREYIQGGIDGQFVQFNWSRSRKGVLRGLHYQLANPQAKLITVVRGAIFDVAVDIRKGSPTFGKWVGAELSEENGEQLFIPEGFAHGFNVLSDTVDLIYQCSRFYAPGDEYGIQWNDPDLGIQWPEVGDEPIVSDKDKANPTLSAQSERKLPSYGGK